MAFEPSGKYTKPTGPQTDAVASYDYAGNGTSADTYTDPNKHEFGFKANSVIIVNAGSNPLAYQWDRHGGTTKDSGVVLPNSTLVLREAYKGGVNIRSLNAGSASAYYISAI